MKNHDADRSAAWMRHAALLVSVFLVAFSTACAPGGEGEAPAEEEEPTPAEQPMAESAESSGGPRIWFISPEDGATVTSPVELQFGHENFELMPKGTMEPETGHHHVGVDTECLPAGEIIPEAAPWIHLGDASAEMQMQLPPGEHTLTIQIGDGEHRTLDEPGLCQTITVNVVEGEEM